MGVCLICHVFDVFARFSRVVFHVFARVACRQGGGWSPICFDGLQVTFLQILTGFYGLWCFVRFEIGFLAFVR